MQNLYYVYQYIDPRTALPFYIGKGIGTRYLFHLKETAEKNTNKRKYNRIQEIYQDNKHPILEKIQENMSNSEACVLEKSLIKKYGRLGLDANGILLNYGEGGNGGATRTGMKCSEEQKKKQSVSMTGKNIGIKNGMYGKHRFGKDSPGFGKKRSEESKINHSKKMTGKFSGDKHPLYGTKWSSERRRKTLEKLCHKWKIIKDGHEVIVNNIREFCDAHSLNRNSVYWSYKNNKKHKGFYFIML